jgi:hypothetical protein
VGSSKPVAGGPQPAPIENPSDPVRVFAFGLGFMLLFLRVSMLHQIQTELTGINLRLLFLIGIPALLGVVLAGGIQRTLRSRTAWYWIGFTGFMALSVPWSVWKMGSAMLFLTYIRTDLIMLFVIGGLVLTWRECKLMMYAVAGGAVVTVLASRLFAKEGGYGGRLGLESGSIQDPNDFACHLLLTLPFLLWVAHSTKSVVLRLFALAGVAGGIYVILRTASRGALVGLVVAALFVLWRGTARQRIVLLAGAAVLIPVLVVALPKQTLQRVTSFSASDPSASQEALGSSAMRVYLLRKSLDYALHNPIFGVGAGQFAWAEGVQNRIGGTTHGYWHQTHNTYMQVASECGIPALILFVAGIVSTWLLLNSTWRQARARPDCKDIATASFYAMLAMVAFCTAITFLSFAYFFYLPALAGLGIALDRTARAEFSSRAAQIVEPQQPPWGVPPSGFRGRISPGLTRTARQAAS